MVDIEWLVNNLDLFSAIYTFSGQFKFFIAISIEAIPGRDPYLLDLQYIYRVSANFDYSVAAMLRVLQVYIRNIEAVITDDTSDTTVNTSTVSNGKELSQILASNKVSQLLVAVPENVTQVRLIRQGRGKRWKKVNGGNVIKIYPFKLDTEATI